jgi:hypothetical protein
MSMNTQIVLADVGLADIETIFDELHRLVAEHIHDLRGPDTDLEPVLPDPKASELEQQMRNSLFSSLTQSEKDLELFGMPVADADRLQVLLHKVKELDNHAQGGPCVLRLFWSPAESALALGWMGGCNSGWVGHVITSCLSAVMITDWTAR